MSHADYCNAVKTGASIDWRCLTCDFPQAESTALSENLSEISASANPDADFDSEETTRGLAQWTEPARQRTITAAPVNPDPGTSPGSYTGQHADSSGFRQKPKRHQRSSYRTMQRRLFDLWSQYEDGLRISKELLEACAHLVQPM